MHESTSKQILRGSFSAVSKPTLAMNYMCESRFLQWTTRVKALDDMYKIYRLLHRSDLKVPEKKSAKFFKMDVNFSKFPVFQSFCRNFATPLRKCNIISKFAENLPNLAQHFRNSSFLKMNTISNSFASLGTRRRPRRWACSAWPPRRRSWWTKFAAAWWPVWLPWVWRYVCSNSKLERIFSLISNFF